jgi:hypothetical protein
MVRIEKALEKLPKVQRSKLELKNLSPRSTTTRHWRHRSNIDIVGAVPV